MNILTINVRSDETPVVVEFVGEAEEKITVQLTPCGSSERNEQLEQAASSLNQAIKMVEIELGRAPTPAQGDTEDQRLEKGLKDSFPASDPVAVTTPSTPASADPKS
ncbi:hypothetical protein JAU75_13195 [Ochrobactrum sp. Q0168]|uniref:hypothetical protein n=1 Tax=Ochrobactrum sp. Q0168 TaxID=2793241 RepID=UPI0018EDF145|nr:hypothetical protein [Ochrobactrum sp. Q0168]